MNKQEPQNLFPWTQSSLYQSLSYVSLVSFSAKPLKQVLFVCCIYCLHYFTSHLFLNPRQPGFSPHLSKNALVRVTNSLLAVQWTQYTLVFTYWTPQQHGTRTDPSFVKYLPSSASVAFCSQFSSSGCFVSISFAGAFLPIQTQDPLPYLDSLGGRIQF